MMGALTYTSKFIADHNYIVYSIKLKLHPSSVRPLQTRVDRSLAHANCTIPHGHKYKYSFMTDTSEGGRTEEYGKHSYPRRGPSAHQAGLIRIWLSRGDGRAFARNYVNSRIIKKYMSGRVSVVRPRGGFTTRVLRTGTGGDVPREGPALMET